MRPLDDEQQQHSDKHSEFSATAAAMLSATTDDIDGQHRHRHHPATVSPHLKSKTDMFTSHNNNHHPPEQIGIHQLISTQKPQPNLCRANEDKQPPVQEKITNKQDKPLDEKMDTKVSISNGGPPSIVKVNGGGTVQPTPEDAGFRNRTGSVCSTVSVTSNGGHKAMRFALGISLTILSAFFFSLTTVIVKYVTNVKPSEMALYRYIGILFMVFPVVLESKEPIFGPNCWWFRLWMILRGISGATSLFFRYTSVSYISLADTTIIVLSMPVFVFIFARIFLKEPFGKFHVAALCLSLIGICFASKIEIIFGARDTTSSISKEDQLIGTSFALGAVVVGSLVYVFVRKMRKTHHAVILFNFGVVSIIEMTLVNLFTVGIRLPPMDGVTPWLIVALGMLSFYGQLLLTKAVQMEEAGVVSVIRVSAEAFFAFILQIILFDEVPDIYSTLGAILVLSAVILLTIRKYVVELPDDSKTKKRLIFLTK